MTFDEFSAVARTHTQVIYGRRNSDQGELVCSNKSELSFRVYIMYRMLLWLKQRLRFEHQALAQVSVKDPGTFLLSVSNNTHTSFRSTYVGSCTRATASALTLHRRNCICAFTVLTTCLPTCTSVVQVSSWPLDHRHVILNRESSLGQNNISVGRDEHWYDIRFIVPQPSVPGHSVRVCTSWLRSSGSDQHTPRMARHCGPTGRSSTKFDPESLFVSSYPIPSRDRSGSC